LYVQKGFGERMNRKEAVTLFTDLVANGYVQPHLVLIEQKKPDKFQLKIKGNYDSQQIEKFLKKKGLSCEKNMDYLIIFKQ
jgi:hypothetical protein